MPSLDESAKSAFPPVQATEVAALQPLVHGCRRLVLVGDPQQLPATVFSQRAKEVAMERSLFERLQQGGCPVKVLSVQYRMHPEIRAFPSRFFYQDQLQVGAVYDYVYEACSLGCPLWEAHNGGRGG